MTERKNPEETAKAVDKLRQIALEATYSDERKRAIGLLADFGNLGIPALADVAKEARYSDERLLALDKIKEAISKPK